jgi:outer membrane immunogenic protein
MKTVLLGGVAVVALAASSVSPVMVTGAVAADLALKAPEPAWSWTGFYVGGNVVFGASRGATSFSGDAATTALIAAGSIPFSLGGNEASGVIGGVQAGYNVQTGRIVYGIEADIDAGHIGGSQTALVPPFTTSASQQLNYLGTVQGRLGYAVSTPLLLFVTGGFAFGGASVSTAISSSPCPPCGAATSSATLGGWVAGGGFEYAMGPEERKAWGLSLKAELLYYDLGTLSQSLPAPPLAATTSTPFKGGLARAGVNYKF